MRNLKRQDLEGTARDLTGPLLDQVLVKDTVRVSAIVEEEVQMPLIQDRPHLQVHLDLWSLFHLLLAAVQRHLYMHQENGCMTGVVEVQGGDRDHTPNLSSLQEMICQS